MNRVDFGWDRRWFEQRRCCVRSRCVAACPEYRIAEDVRIATDAPVDFALGVLSSLLTAIIFIQVLWNIGGDAAFTLFGYRLWIPGYSVGSVIIYSGIVTTAMLLVGSPLMKVIQIKNQTEAELITAEICSGTSAKA